MPWSAALAEGERVGLNARIEERNLECVVSHGAVLADKLIEPLLGDSAPASAVNVNSVGGAGWLSVDEYVKADGSSSRCRAHDEMKIAGVEAVHDSPAGRVQQAACSPAVQSPGRAQWLSFRRAGAA